MFVSCGWIEYPPFNEGIRSSLQEVLFFPFWVNVSCSRKQLRLIVFLVKLHLDGGQTLQLLAPLCVQLHNRQSFMCKNIFPFLSRKSCYRLSYIASQQVLSNRQTRFSEKDFCVVFRNVVNHTACNSRFNAVVFV